MSFLNITELKNMLENVHDPRSKRGIRHKLSDVILIMLCAALCGYDNSTDIAMFGEEHSEHFNEFFGIKKIPSHDTISRILRMLDFTMLSELFSTFLQLFYPSTYTKYADKTVTHIDGKAVKAAANKCEGQMVTYMLNSYVEGSSISLECMGIGDKENEISMIPKYLDFLGVKNSIITIDAIGCNSTILNDILNRGCSFFLIVKENQKKLLNTVNEHITELEKNKHFNDLPSYSTLDKNHGRIEEFKATLIKDTKFIFDSYVNRVFNNIGTICVIDKKTTKKENGELKQTETRSICITDLTTLTAKEILEIKLSHWNIEASHWVLDVQYREDDSTSRKGNSILNLSILRKFGMRMHKSSKEFCNKPIKRMFMRNSIHFDHIVKMLSI